MPDTPPSRPASPVSSGDCFATVLMMFIAVPLASIYGGQAESLGIPGAGFVAMMAPAGVLFSMLCVPWLLPSSGRQGWMSFIPALLACGFMGLPSLLLSWCSQETSLKRSLSLDEIRQLRSVLGVPVGMAPAHKDLGPRLQIRSVNLPADVHEKLNAWLATLPPAATEPPEFK